MELKFRAWDVFNGSMIDWHEPYMTNKILPLCMPRYHYKDTAGGSREYFLMQFTGLTDPNGVEVYAGDRIQYPGCKSIATVVFEDGCFIAHHDFIKRDPELLRRAVGTEETEGHAVVIGNIHQHSHLLDKGE